MATEKKQIRRSEIVSNPTQPDVAIEIDGEEFRLCFDFRALAIAKAKLKAAGVEVNLLRAIDFNSLDVDTLPALFFGAALRYQPELTWQRAVALVNMRTAVGIFTGLASAYASAMMEPGKNPQPAAAKS
jgi:hypothetical protein